MAKFRFLTFDNMKIHGVRVYYPTNFPVITRYIFNFPILTYSTRTSILLFYVSEIGIRLE